MKKIIVLMSLFLSVTVLNAQTETKTKQAKTETKAKKAPKPVIAFTQTTHDYGNIVQGANGQCVFTFKNNGKKPIILTNVRASCGCTTPSWPKEAITPKKSGEIVVTYDTQRIGYFNKTISVYTNLQDEPFVLTIQGQVLPKPAEGAPAEQK